MITHNAACCVRVGWPYLPGPCRPYGTEVELPHTHKHVLRGMTSIMESLPEMFSPAQKLSSPNATNTGSCHCTLSPRSPPPLSHLDHHVMQEERDKKLGWWCYQWCWCASTWATDGQCESKNGPHDGGNDQVAMVRRLGRNAWHL